MDYKREYIELLKKSLAGENETIRMYLACMAVAPNSAIAKLLEIQADETDHVAIISDLLLEAMAGESADQEALLGAPAGAQRPSPQSGRGSALGVRSGSGGERTSAQAPNRGAEVPLGCKGAARDLAGGRGEAKRTLRGRVPGVE